MCNLVLKRLSCTCDLFSASTSSRGGKLSVNGCILGGVNIWSLTNFCAHLFSWFLGFRRGDKTNVLGTRMVHTGPKPVKQLPSNSVTCRQCDTSTSPTHHSNSRWRKSPINPSMQTSTTTTAQEHSRRPRHSRSCLTLTSLSR